jgi:hypothetical protein
VSTPDVKEEVAAGRNPNKNLADCEKFCERIISTKPNIAKRNQMSAAEYSRYRWWLQVLATRHENKIAVIRAWSTPDTDRQQIRIFCS